MKWFSEGLSKEEIKKRYKDLARQWHPDMHTGKDTYEEAEENFKEITDEYTQAVKAIVAVEENWFDVDAATDKLYNRLVLAEQLVKEIYPRSRVSYVAFVLTPTIEFIDDNIPMNKMMHIVTIVQSVLDTTRLAVEFHRPCRKKKFTCIWDTVRRWLYIECEPDEVPNEWVVAPNARRYMYSVCLRWEKVFDTKSNIHYVKRKSPKADLRKDLLGL